MPVDKADIRVKPKTASQKYSTGPNASATLASGGAKISKKSAPTRPPTTDARQARVMARSPSPRFAIGNPSKVVAMADGVPGVLSKIAEYAPPYIAPVYMAPIIMSAVAGGMEKVIGTRTATAIVAVSPGREPIIVPAITPPRAKAICSGVSACKKCSNMEIPPKLQAGNYLIIPASVAASV